MRAGRLGRMLAGDEASAVPPPQGHREIQQEELGRLFGRMTRLRVVALPPLLALAVWAGWVDLAPGRRILVGAVAAALVAFFVTEWLRWRARGLTPGAIPLNLSVGIVGIALLAVGTGGLASPILPFSIVLGFVSGVFVPWPVNALLAAFQVASAWAFAGLGAIIGDVNVFPAAGGAARAAPAAWTVTHATALTFVYALATTVGRGVRWSFDRMVLRTAAAQQESLRAHAERAEELTALSAEIAHELKNPLASVKGLAALLQQQLVEGKGAERLGVLRREVDRMQSVLEEFLNFSRPLVPLALGDSDLGALCHEVAALHEGMARERAVELAVRAGAVPVRCDPRKAKQVLINLVQNALDASPAGAAVELEAAPAPGGGAQVTVLDRGRGVEPALAGQVFSPGVTSKAGGSGLGLTIARALARQHGGDVELAPRPGGGTAAVVTLPGRAPAAAGGGGR